MKHTVIILELLFIRASHHSQDGGNRSLSWDQDCSYQEHLGPFPDPFPEDLFKLTQHVYNRFRQSQHLFLFLQLNLREASSVFRFLSIDWIKSTEGHAKFPGEFVPCLLA